MDIAEGQRVAHHGLVFVHARKNDFLRGRTAGLANVQLARRAHFQPMHVGSDDRKREGIRLDSEAELGPRRQTFPQKRHTIAQRRLLEQVERRAVFAGEGHQLGIVHRSFSRFFVRARRRAAASRLSASSAARSTFPFLVSGIASMGRIFVGIMKGGSVSKAWALSAAASAVPS